MRAQGAALGSTRQQYEAIFALKGRHKLKLRRGLCRPFRAKRRRIRAAPGSPGPCPGVSCSAPSDVTMKVKGVGCDDARTRVARSVHAMTPRVWVDSRVP